MTGSELRERRKALALTQSQLGTRFGVSRWTIYRWERGDEEIPAWVPLALEGLAIQPAALVV